MINIACCTDCNYVMQTSVMILSACMENANEEMAFHVVTDGSVIGKAKERMKGIIAPFKGITMYFYSVNEDWFASLSVSSQFTKATFYRLSIAEILPTTIDKVLFLDGDLIVTDSLSNLWNTNIGDVAIAGVPDQYEQNSFLYDRLGYSQDLGYFNAGVLLINLAYWREHSMLSVFLDFIKKNPEKTVFYDQDVMNCIFCQNKIVLPLKYNAQNEFFFKVKGWDTKKYGPQLEEAIKTPVTVHFTRSQKPWIVGCPHPYTKEFNRYRGMTPWKHRSIIDTLKYSGLRHTIGFYTRKWGLKAPMDNPYEGILA